MMHCMVKCRSVVGGGLHTHFALSFYTFFLARPWLFARYVYSHPVCLKNVFLLKYTRSINFQIWLLLPTLLPTHLFICFGQKTFTFICNLWLLLVIVFAKLRPSKNEAWRGPCLAHSKSSKNLWSWSSVTSETIQTGAVGKWMVLAWGILFSFLIEHLRV